jgi:NAD-dependent dihydropyrimidine dehydrogenase PreA subunit
MERLIYLRNTVTLELDQERCVGCGMCLEVCPHAVFTLRGGIAEMGHRDACMECGACSKNCPAGAIRVQAGVGCAAAVINSVLGRKSACCCTVATGGTSDDHGGGGGERKGTACC